MVVFNGSFHLMHLASTMVSYFSASFRFDERLASRDWMYARFDSTASGSGCLKFTVQCAYARTLADMSNYVPYIAAIASSRVTHHLFHAVPYQRCGLS
jgi:hypothetical protein